VRLAKIDCPLRQRPHPASTKYNIIFALRRNCSTLVIVTTHACCRERCFLKGSSLRFLIVEASNIGEQQSELSVCTAVDTPRGPCDKCALITQEKYGHVCNLLCLAVTWNWRQWRRHEVRNALQIGLVHRRIDGTTTWYYQREIVPQCTSQYLR
jgi:hypothetical protein